MTGYKYYQPLFFRSAKASDVGFVSKWVAAILRQSAVWERGFGRILQWEWERFASSTGQDSWMAMSGRRRLFFVEFATAGNIYITGSAAFLDNLRLMPLYLQDLAVHLYGLGIRGIITVTVHGAEYVYLLLLPSSEAFLEFIVPLPREKREKEHKTSEPE